MMLTVFVTGVNGLLGTNLTNFLLAKGYFVKGLVRDKSRYRGHEHAHLQLVEGDLFDDFTKLLSGVDYVVHAAACTCQNLLEFAEYWKINGNATIQLYHAAVQCKVKRFVFVSTANTLGYGSLEKPGSEGHSIREPFSASFYAQSKKGAEDCLLSYSHATEVVIVNPTFMLGAFDTKPSSGRLILMGWKKKAIFYPPGGKNFVHVEDVAGGIVRCIENGRNGERYILAGKNLSYGDFFKKLNVIANQKPVMVKLPKALLLGIGVFGELLRSLNIKSSLSLVNMRILCTTNYYSANKSKTELGVNYRPVETAIADALNYFRTR
jgi:dihydroflavonol-4-reductase